MTKYDNREYSTESQEGVANREADYANRTEIRRIHSGNEGEDIADDAQEEAEQEADKEKKREKPEWIKKIERFLTGEILLSEAAARVYYFLTLLGIIFLISIFAMFATFQHEIRRNKLQAEIGLLKERSIRISEERAQKTSHSAITNKLKERNIKLEDPTVTPIILR